LQQQQVQREQYKRQQAKEQSQRIQNRQQQEIDKSERIINAKRQFRSQLIHQNHQRYVQITFLLLYSYILSEHKQPNNKQMIVYVINKINLFNKVTIVYKHVIQTNEKPRNFPYVRYDTALRKLLFIFSSFSNVDKTKKLNVLVFIKIMFFLKNSIDYIKMLSLVNFANKPIIKRKLDEIAKKNAWILFMISKNGVSSGPIRVSSRKLSIHYFYPINRYMSMVFLCLM
jgi:hypothetical protein